MTVTVMLVPIIDLYPFNKQVVLAQVVIGIPLDHRSSLVTTIEAPRAKSET